MASLFDDIEEDGLFGDIPSDKGTNYLKDFAKGAVGTAAAAGDIVGGMVKVPLQAATAVAGKVLNSDVSTQAHWETARDTIERAFPSLGKSWGVDDNAGYTAPMKPFELYGEGVEWAAKKVSGGNKDVEGAVNIGGSVLPIPFAGKAVRGAGKVIEAIDPTVSGKGYKKPAALPKTAEDIILERKQAEAQTRTEDVVTDTRKGSQLSKEALQAALREKELQKQSAFWREPQHADMIQESPMDRMARDLGGEPLRPVEQGLSALDQQLVERSTPEQWAAQDQIAARQAQMEQEVTRQTRLEMMAAERARQEGAPTVSAEHRAWAEAQESARLAVESEKAQRMQQMDIVEDYGNNDPMSRMPEMRVDENGIPIRSDLSMEAQQLQNPLQRNLWGDELGPALDQTRSLTEAIDAIPDSPFKGDERDIALQRLKGEIQAPKDLEAAKAAAEKLPPSVRSGNPSLTRAGWAKKQGGGGDLDLLTLGLSRLIKTGKEPPRPDTPATPRSLPMLQAREQERLTSKLANLSEFVPYTTVEEAVYHAKNAKDITKDLGQKSLAPGMNFAAIYTNNPILKWANYAFRNARNTADRMSRKYITADDVGLSPLFSKMTDMERVQVMDTLQSGDRHQMKIDDAMMTELGMSDTQKQFIKSYYEADAAMFNGSNKWRESLGFKPMPYREGHFPGVFSGAYKSLVMGDKVNKDGSIAIDKNGNPIQEVKGVIATDTVAQREAAKAYFKSQNSGYTIIDKKRQGLVGNAVRSDLFSGMNDIMSMLAENDPRFAEVQAAIQEAVKQGNKNLFDFAKHELAKKGVVGNMGNKPWLDKNTNVKEGFKALVDYFEEGFLYNELQEPLRDAKSLATNPEVAHLQNTLAYLDKYVKNITGQGTNVIGQALNAVLDAPFALLGETKLGVGPKVPMEVANTVKNKMSQVFMGWGNYMFTLQQLMQPAQTALPTFQLIASRLGDHTGALRSMSKGGIDFMQMWSDNPKNVPEHMQTAYKYAMDHGLFNFSEMERAYEGVKSKAGRIADNIAEFNILLGERATRTPMFMGYVDLLVKNGIDVKDALPIAEHATQLSMVDYHAWERAQVYSGMGVLGQFAGALTTYKHGSTGMNFVLGKEIGRTGNPVPLGLSVAAMLMLAGITGLPFYDDIDSAFGAMTEKFGSKRQSIRQAFLENMPEWANSGVISAATGINLQSKFSAANMIPNPDEIGKSLSPQISGSVQIIGDAIDLAKNQDKEALRNLLGNLPSPWRGEAAYQLRDEETNAPVDRKGGTSYPYTDKEWTARRLTGSRPTREANMLTKLWEAKKQEKADQEKKIQITEEYSRGIRNNTLTAQRQQELFDEYTARGGDINTLIKLHESVPKNQAMNPAQRAGGVAPGNTVPSINRFQYYNK